MRVERAVFDEMNYLILIIRAEYKRWRDKNLRKK
jgi:hypothetical protein